MSENIHFVVTSYPLTRRAKGPVGTCAGGLKKENPVLNQPRHKFHHVL